MWFISAVKLLVTRNTFMALFQRKLLRLEVDIIVNLGLEQKTPVRRPVRPGWQWQVPFISCLHHYFSKSILFMKIFSDLTFSEMMVWSGIQAPQWTISGLGVTEFWCCESVRIYNVKNFPVFYPLMGTFFVI